MTVHGAYTGIIRDDIGEMFTDMRMRYPGIDTSTGLYRANLTRSQAVANVSALTTEVMTSVPVYFYAGEAVENITFVSATTAANSPTNQWVALYDPTGNLVAQTPDLESDSWAANTAKTFTFADPVTIADSGWHRVAIMVKATTPPTLAGVTLHNEVLSAALVTGELPLSATSGSSLTDTAPGTIGALTAIAGVPLCIVT